VIGGVASAVSTGTPDRVCCQRLNDQETAFSHNVRMSNEHSLTLRQVDQARGDFAAIESDLQFVMSRLAKQPTRGDLAKAALGIIFCSAVFTTLFVWIVWH
jgi:hypothetical protein